MRKTTKKAVAKPRVKRQITVQLGALVKPLEARKCDAGTSIEKFLADNGMKMGSNVLVNGDAVKASYKLKNGDIVTTMGSVSGGL
jgi:sulfur carrier protein ThiS